MFEKYRHVSSICEKKVQASKYSILFFKSDMPVDGGNSRRDFPLFSKLHLGFHHVGRLKIFRFSKTSNFDTIIGKGISPVWPDWQGGQHQVLQSCERPQEIIRQASSERPPFPSGGRRRQDRGWRREHPWLGWVPSPWSTLWALHYGGWTPVQWKLNGIERLQTRSWTNQRYK